MEMNRRNFLKAAGAAGVASAALSSVALADEAAAEVEYPKGACASDYECSPVEVGPITEFAAEYTYDVVVVGGGTGGVPAALTAIEEGATACVLQKESVCISQGANESGVELEMSDPQGIKNYIRGYMESVDWRADRGLVEYYTYHSGETMRWLRLRAEEAGNPPANVSTEEDVYEDGTKSVRHEWNYGPKPQCNLELIMALANLAEERGVDFYYETPGVQLIQGEDGTVTGVVGKNADGDYIKFNATMGVILSTGGYGGNPEMMDALHYRDKNNIVNNLGCAFAMGDGIKMALWAGADIDRNHAGGCAFDRAALAEDHHVGMPYSAGLNDIWWPGSQPWLNLNKRGERFANEDVPYDFHINSWLKQPGRFTFQLFDSNYWEDVNAFHSTICSRVVAVPGARNSEVLPGVMPCKSEEEFYNVFMKPALESGRLKQADTIEDLCRQLGMDDAAVERAVASVARYNELAAKGVDDDFGKQQKDLRPIVKAPFYGIAVGTWLLATMNGIRVNTNLQAVNEEQEPIEGLYVIGNDMGGFFNNSYPQMYGGTMQGKTTCFARLAALHAVTGSIYEG